MVNFKQLLEKATAEDLSEPDWETILEIVEEIKTKNVSAKNAMKEFRKRLLDNSGNVVYHTLLVLDSLMKNCASDVHSEVLTVEFMGIIKEIVTSKSSNSEKAVDKALELIGEWKSAFGEQNGYKAINTVFSDLEREGFHIPITPVASAAFIKKAPEWVLSDRCFMCRQEFNRFRGKLRHHCRNCGKSVCAQCSSKRIPLPHFGVEESTRVCDICFKNVDKKGGSEGSTAAADMDADLPVEYLRSSLAQESQVPSSVPSGGGGNSEQEQEEDDLQLAIAMSLNEQENKPKKSLHAPVSHHVPSPTPPPTSATPSAPPPAQSTLYSTIIHDRTHDPPSTYSHQSNGPHTQQEVESANDPLARYLDRSYWEQRKEQQASGVAPPSTTTVAATRDTGPQAQSLGGGVTSSPLAISIQNTINMFVKRLHEVNSNGGSIAADPVVLSLYQNLTAMQPQLLKQVDQVQQQKAKQLAIINKLNEVKEARVTLNKMRREHQDKIKQMEQEQAMLARMQMEQKLALLRQQKQEQLEFQESLQQKRLEVLQSQKTEYEKKVAMQREIERQQLIAQEQKVLQHQFGSAPTGGRVSPQPPQRPHPPPNVMTQQFQLQAEMQPSSMNFDPSSIPLHSLSLHDPSQALPLPAKLDPITMDAAPPPPYNPSATPLSIHNPTQSAVYTSYQAPSGVQSSVSQQSLPLQTSYIAPSNSGFDGAQPPSMQSSSGNNIAFVAGQPPSVMQELSSTMTSGQPPNMIQGHPSTMHPVPGQPLTVDVGHPTQPITQLTSYGLSHNQPSSGVYSQPPPNQPSSGVYSQPPPNQPSSGVYPQHPPNQPSSGVYPQHPPNQPSSGVYSQHPPNQPLSGVYSQPPPNQPLSGVYSNQPSSGVYPQHPPNQPSSGAYPQPGNYGPQPVPPPSQPYQEPPPTQTYAGYQGYQTQYTQQQQLPPQAAAPGTQLNRQESEPPLISFD